MTLKIIISKFLLIISLLLLFISSTYLYIGIYDELFEPIEKNKLWFGDRSEGIVPLVLFLINFLYFIYSLILKDNLFLLFITSHAETFLPLIHPI